MRVAVDGTVEAEVWDVRYIWTTALTWMEEGSDKYWLRDVLPKCAAVRELPPPLWVWPVVGEQFEFLGVMPNGHTASYGQPASHQPYNWSWWWPAVVTTVLATGAPDLDTTPKPAPKPSVVCNG
jgi:hypothetical protein